MKRLFLLFMFLVLPLSVAKAVTFSISDPYTGSTLKGDVDSSGNASVKDPNTGEIFRGTADGLGKVHIYFYGASDYTTGNIDPVVPRANIAPVVGGYCVPAQAVGCTTEADYQQKQTVSNLYGIPPGGTSLEQCRHQISTYQQTVAKWQDCMQYWYGFNTQTNTVTSTGNAGGQSSAFIKAQATALSQEIDQYLKSYCVKQSGPHTVVTGNGCDCADGFSYSTSERQCIAKGTECQLGRDANTGTCKTQNDKCVEILGQYGYFSRISATSGSPVCACRYGNDPNSGNCAGPNLSNTNTSVSVSAPTRTAKLLGWMGIKTATTSAPQNITATSGNQVENVLTETSSEESGFRSIMRAPVHFWNWLTNLFHF